MRNQSRELSGGTFASAKSLEINPEFTNALFYLAVLEHTISLRVRSKAEELRRLSKAEQWVRDAIRLRNDIFEYHSELACILINSGEAREALAAVDKAPAINPDDPYSLRTKGRRVIDCNKRREAIEVLQLSLQHDPQAAWSHVYLYVAKSRWVDWECKSTSNGHCNLLPTIPTYGNSAFKIVPFNYQES